MRNWPSNLSLKPKPNKQHSLSNIQSEVYLLDHHPSKRQAQSFVLLDQVYCIFCFASNWKMFDNQSLHVCLELEEKAGNKSTYKTWYSVFLYSSHPSQQREILVSLMSPLQFVSRNSCLKDNVSRSKTRLLLIIYGFSSELLLICGHDKANIETTSTGSPIELRLN